MTDIYARRVRSDGTVLSNFTIAHNAGYDSYEPAVAYNPTHDEYLVVYTWAYSPTSSDVWARRVKWDGSWMGAEFLVGRTPDRQHHPAVTYNGDADEYLIVYQNTRSGGGQDIDAVRVRGFDGWAMGWVNVATGANQFRSSPDVAYDAASGHYLMAYTLRPNSASNPGDIYGKTASWNLAHFSSEIPICADANDQDRVALAAGSGEYLAVWQDEPNTTTTWVYARRLSGDGTPQGSGGGFCVAAAPDRHDTTPKVAYGTGYGYLVTWNRLNPGSVHDVYGHYVMPGLDTVVGLEFAIDDGIAEQTSPAVACAASGDCLVVEADNDSPGSDFEIRGRFVRPHSVYLPLVKRNHR
jgi:hypothetical protein